MESVVDRFINAYPREYAFYQEAAKICSELCQAALKESAIRAIVTYRAKEPTKVAAKVRNRNTRKNYEDEEAIRADIVDLAGVRIALYFPDDRKKVAELLPRILNVREVKEFPGQEPAQSSKTFSGYHAEHYRSIVKVAEHDDGSSVDAAVEVQVGSVLMHAWAEVEHDLVYKPESGHLSEDELVILDEVNGLVLAGELALKRLQIAAGRRLSEHGDRRFDNHYDLASFIYKWASDQKPNTKFLPGNVETLFGLLAIADMATPNDLREYLDADLINDADPYAFVTKAIQGILANHPALKEDYLEQVWLPRFAPDGNIDHLIGIFNTLTVLERFRDWWAEQYADPATLKGNVSDLAQALHADPAKRGLQYLILVRDAANKGVALIGGLAPRAVGLMSISVGALIDELKAIGPEAATKLKEIDDSVPGRKIISI